MAAFLPIAADLKALCFCERACKQILQNCKVEDNTRRKELTLLVYFQWIRPLLPPSGLHRNNTDKCVTLSFNLNSKPRLLLTFLLFFFHENRKTEFEFLSTFSVAWMRTYHSVRSDESSKPSISLWSLGKFCHVYFSFLSKPVPSRVRNVEWNCLLQSAINYSTP